MVKYGIVFVIFFTIIVSIDATCVVQGICGSQKNHVCLPTNIGYLKATKKVHKLCPKFPTGSNVCCNDDQIKMLERGLYEARRWFGGKCYGLMRNLFCHMHCSPDQDSFLYGVTTDHEKVTSFTVNVTAPEVNNLWNACKDKTFLFVRLVNKVCINRPCDAKEFLRSIGTSRNKGGKSPFQINFNFI